MNIKLVVYVRVRKNKKGKTFPSYSTKMNIIVKGEEEKGAQEKYVDLKFGKDVDRKIIDSLKGKNYITCNAEDVSAPFVYEVSEETNEDGVLVKKYPVVWVNGVLEAKVAPKKHPTQSAFVTDEEETEETEIA